MHYTSEKNGAITHITLEEPRLDAAQAIRFKEGLRTIADEGADHILLDMGKVEFMDSSGLGALVSMLKYMGCEKKFEIASLTPMVEKVFKLTRMDEVFQVYPSAVEAFQTHQNSEATLI